MLGQCCITLLLYAKPILDDRLFPLLGQMGKWEGVGPWKSQHFWAPNGTRLKARCHFTGPKNASISRAPPPSTFPHNRFAHIKSYTISAIGYYCMYLSRLYCICLTSINMTDGLSTLWWPVCSQLFSGSVCLTEPRGSASPAGEVRGSGRWGGGGGGGHIPTSSPCEPLIISLVPSYMLRIRYIYSSINVQIVYKSSGRWTFIKKVCYFEYCHYFPYYCFLGARNLYF